MKSSSDKINFIEILLNYTLSISYTTNEVLPPSTCRFFINLKISQKGEIKNKR